MHSSTWLLYHPKLTTWHLYRQRCYWK
jgi:hypothetical protein